MNKKQVKRVNEKTAEVLVKWLQSIVPEEDKDKINEKNYKTFLPEAPYFIKEKSRRVSCNPNRKAMIIKLCFLQMLQLPFLYFVLQEQ